MRIFTLVLLCLPLFIVLSCKKADEVSAQQSQFFVKLYGTHLSQTGNDVIQTDDGGYAFIGSSTTDDKGTDIILVKTDEFGIQQWSKTFGDSLDDTGTSIDLTNDGYILSGTYMYNSGLTDMIVIKTDFDGNEQWRQIIGSTDYNERSSAVLASSSGEYIVVGSTTAPVIKADDGDPFQNPAGQWDIVVSAINDQGDSVLWSKQYGGQMADFGNDIIEKQPSGYFVLGTTVSLHNEGIADIVLISVSSDGGIVGPAFFGESNEENRASSIIKHKGDLVVIGNVQTSGSVISSPEILRFSGETIDVNNLKWQKVIDLGMSATTTSVASIGDNIAFTGGIVDSEDGNQLYVSYVNGSGAIGETTILGSGGLDIGNSIISTEDERLIIGGTTGFEGNSMMELVKVNAEGKLKE